MVEDVDPQKQQTVAAKTNEGWKNWLLIGLTIAVILLLYYNIVYSKNFTIDITGTEMIIFATVLCGFLYWYFKTHREPVLPEKHVIARDVANWCYQHNGGLEIDYAGCEVEIISDKTALVYFIGHARTYKVEATPEGQPVKVVSEGWRDLTSTLINIERSEIVKAHTRSVASRDKIESDLRGMGLAVDNK